MGKTYALLDEYFNTKIHYAVYFTSRTKYAYAQIHDENLKKDPAKPTVVATGSNNDNHTVRASSTSQPSLHNLVSFRKLDLVPLKQTSTPNGCFSVVMDTRASFLQQPGPVPSRCASRPREGLASQGAGGRDVMAPHHLRANCSASRTPSRVGKESKWYICMRPPKEPQTTYRTWGYCDDGRSVAPVNSCPRDPRITLGLDVFRASRHCYELPGRMAGARNVIASSRDACASAQRAS